MGETTQSGLWLATPFMFGVVALTGDNGTSFPENILIVLVR